MLDICDVVSSPPAVSLMEVITCVFWVFFPSPELSELEQLPRDSGLSVCEGAWTQVLEEALHVPAPLRSLLLC